MIPVTIIAQIGGIDKSRQVLYDVIKYLKEREITMTYDFTSYIDRSKDGSDKWNMMYKADPGVPPDILPMSIADMEFLTAPEIREGLKEFIDTAIQGYTGPNRAYLDAVTGWQERRHGYRPKEEWIVTTSGVVPALCLLTRALTEPGDGVIIQPPVYPPFTMAAESAGCRVVENPLVRRENTYEMDFEDLEKKAGDPKNKVLILCSPHNPVGKVWSRSDLEKVVDICARNNVFIIDDEIHNDLILPGHTHTALPTVSAQASRICAYCTAPSKTFNLAGMQLSNLFIEDGAVREKLAALRYGIIPEHQTAISYAACRLAYDRAEGWLEALLEVVAGNAKLVEDFLAARMPQARCYPLEGTYLLWVDFRGLGLDHEALEALMLKARLFLDDGAIFGGSGTGFQRIALALPGAALERALERLERAWREISRNRAAGI